MSYERQEADVMVNKVKQKMQTERGSVTVEASISMVTFTFVMISLLTLINVARAQMLIQDAVNKACLEISEYMYLYQISGLYSLDRGMSETGSGAGETLSSVLADTDKAIAGVESIMENISGTGQNLAAGGNVSLDDLQNSYEELLEDKDSITEQIDSLKGTFSDISDDPLAFGKQLVALGASAGMGKAKSYIFGNILAANMCSKYLGANNESIGNKEYADKKLKSLGVVDGFEGLDFRYSCIFPDNAPTDVNIIVVYEVKVFPWLTDDLKVRFSQSASTRGWIGGDAVERTQ